MNLSYSFPNRSEPLNFRHLAAVIALAFLALTIWQVGSTFQALSGNPAQVQVVSAAVSAAPQALPVPAPSEANWQHGIPQLSATPAPAVSQPTVQPVATPPAGK